MTTKSLSSPAARYDRARFYSINGTRYPSVTTILGIIDKSGPLMGWAVKEERKAFEAAILEVLSQKKVTRENLLDAVISAVAGQKASLKAQQKALDIGSGAHALIEWESKRRIGKDIGSRPQVPDASELAFMSWEDWAKGVGFEPVAVEHTVYCLEHGYAGTLDWIGKVNGVLTVGDIKTGKAIYAEAFLQNVAYRYAVRKDYGWLPGMILRLPKTLEDPTFEVMNVPESSVLEDFLAALKLWRWQRSMSGLPVA